MPPHKQVLRRKQRRTLAKFRGFTWNPIQSGRVRIEAEKRTAACIWVTGSQPGAVSCAAQHDEGVYRLHSLA